MLATREVGRPSEPVHRVWFYHQRDVPRRVDDFDMGGVMLDLADLKEQKVDLVERRSFSPEFEKTVGSDLIQIF